MYKYAANIATIFFAHPSVMLCVLCICLFVLSLSIRLMEYVRYGKLCMLQFGFVFFLPRCSSFKFGVII